MNLIEAKYFKTKFWSEEYPCIYIDGVRLDSIINQLKPDQDYLGLIPTLFSALNHDVEEMVVWERVLPKNGTAILPLLMCPDDVDLYCTLIVVEVLIKGNTVIWTRFGLDDSSDDDYVPRWLGTEVNWFENSPAYEFKLETYKAMLDVFSKERVKNKS
ncbi:hypothetical protein [Pseudoalteromonas sp. B62]|uniref:hypothetical protein n=1 Tax=Pseudoalteromonas sp. B62 TaxID=630483 RepID=UPI00301CE89F